MIDLQPFCGEDGRYALSTPWSRDGVRYATDGRWCVRAFDSPGIPNAGSDPRPDVAALFSSFRLCGRQLPPSPGITDGSTEECMCGTLHEDCMGEGCGRCRLGVKPRSDCEACHGKGYVCVEVPVPEKIGINWFEGRYLMKLRTLPDLLVSFPTWEAHTLEHVSMMDLHFTAYRGRLEGILAARLVNAKDAARWTPTAADVADHDATDRQPSAEHQAAAGEP